jgi:hypothetical protein
MADDFPIAFSDLSWLAVRAAPPEAIIAALDLSDPVRVTWRQGLNAVLGDYWDFDAPPNAFLSRVFITPKVAGWRLAVGGWLGGMDEEEPGSDIADYCRRLSREFGEAHAFTTQGRMDWYSWCLARSGVVYRHFVWADSPVVDTGAPTPTEARLRKKGSRRPADWYPSEAMVMAIAGECSIAPNQLATMKSAGPGYLAVTAWGRQHGVPSRSLDDQRHG